MEHTGFWSIVPIVVAIACAVVTRQVILALFLGSYVGVLTIEGGLQRSQPEVGVAETPADPNFARSAHFASGGAA